MTSLCFYFNLLISEPDQHLTDCFLAITLIVPYVYIVYFYFCDSL